jgi:hypothetical protein
MYATKQEKRGKRAGNTETFSKLVMTDSTIAHIISVALTRSTPQDGVAQALVVEVSDHSPAPSLA